MKTCTISIESNMMTSDKYNTEEIKTEDRLKDRRIESLSNRYTMKIQAVVSRIMIVKLVLKIDLFLI
jgi:hypothetical protein